MPAKRTLDGFPRFRIIQIPGTGGRGSQGGFSPWRSMRQRLMRASSALPTAVCYSLTSSAHRLQRHCRHASIRTLIAALAAGAHWCSQFIGCCHLSNGLQQRGPSRDPPRARSHPNSAPPHVFAQKQSFPIPLRRYAGLRFPVIQRIVNLSGYPQPVQQHRQLACHPHHRSPLRVLASLFRLPQSPLPQIAVRRPLP